MRLALVLALGGALLGVSALGHDAEESPELPRPPPTDFCESDLSDAGCAVRTPGVGSPAECEAMVADALAWASCHGLLMHATPPEDFAEASGANLLVHAPFALTPAEFPEHALEQAQALAPLFNKLTEAVAADLPWIERTLQATVSSDDFTRRLLRLAARIQRETPTQRAKLMVLRSDYMLHTPDEASRAGLLQIELNTIAASFASLSAKVSELHRMLAQRFPSLRKHLWERRGRPRRLSLDDAIPPNLSLERIAAALGAAHRSYGVSDAVVLFVVQPGERNAVDQELLRSQLWKAHGVSVICRTLAQVELEGRLEGPKRKLMLGKGAAAKEVAIAYFRAGYTPDDYPSTRQWNARLTIERSHAIKCPSIECHLAGAKKVQQQLAVPGELERFVSAKEAAALREVFAGLWALEGPSETSEAQNEAEVEAAAAMASAKEDPSGFVMKPQREGGGHNFFGEELASALRSLSRAQRSAFILMQKILPPAFPAVLVRNGELHRGDAVSELGVYSTYVRSASGKLLINGAAGHLLRSKLVGTDEGGVAAGYACLSSPLASLAGVAAQPKKR